METILSEPIETLKGSYRYLHTTIANTITTSFLLLISLAWNDVVQSVINSYYPKRDADTIKGKVYYAVSITIIVLLIQSYILPYAKVTLL